DDILLGTGIRPAPPLLGLLELPQPPQHPAPRLVEALAPRRPSLRRREPAEVQQRRVGFLERPARRPGPERRRLRQLVEPGAQRLQARDILPPALLVALLGLAPAGLQALGRARETVTAP